MPANILSRREFVKRSLTAAGAAALAPLPASRLFAAPEAWPDLVSVKGEDAYAAACKAIDLAGGVGRFLGKTGRIGILVNAPAWWKRPGSHTSTDVVLAAVESCLKAGFKDIIFLQDPAPGFWERSSRSAAMADVVKAVKPATAGRVEVAVKGGLALKKAKVSRDWMDVDAVIDLPIAKDHAGTRYSGCLKNMMGACADDTNRFFHAGSGAKGEYDDVDFLSQCIADLNLVRKPSFCLADATVVLGENGPAGPGTLLRPGRVVAGADPVAVDAYCAGLLGRSAADIAMLRKAAAHGLGRMDPAKLALKEAAV
ncbi:MAG: DUF362 domain-containing protein [Acidobacteriota bacterium]|nr:DUF362 domain-containing protein [Acidobacteriota bacterium]